jgi:hypothetical protein
MRLVGASRAAGRIVEPSVQATGATADAYAASVF